MSLIEGTGAWNLGTPYDRFAAALVRTNGADIRNGQARCPAHDDRNPSLSVDVASDGRVLLKCHANCDTESVVAAVGLTMADLFDEARRPDHDRPQVVARYPYVDESGTVLFHVERIEPGYDGKRKSFVQRPANGRKGPGSMKGVRTVLFRLPDVIEAVAAGQTVYVVEGEKDALALERAGYVATTNPGGAGKWRDWYNSALAGADVVVVADRDKAGLDHAQQVAAELAGVAANVRVAQPARGKDAADHLAAGLDVGKLEPVTLDDTDDASAEMENGAGDGSCPVKLTPASAVGIDRPYWVWENRIPVGGTTLMPGREGMGKTALVCWLMARLTRGQLAGHRFGKPAHVVYVGHEDDRASVLVPRLTAAGADLDRVHFVDMPHGVAFSVGVDTDALRHALAGLDVALVVIDPLDGHLVGVDTHRKAEVQQSVMKLAVLSQALRCGALGLAHLNKGEVRDILARVNGSVGFTTSVRSVLGVGEHPEDPAERVCVVAKANMTDKAKVPAIRFRVEGASVPHPDGGDPIDTGVVVMLGEQEGIDPNDVIDSGSPADKSAREEAVDWLYDVLADGPQSSKDVKAWAKAADISERTLKRALTGAGVEVSRLNTERGRPTIWALRPFRANGFGPNHHGPKDAPTVTREDAADDGGFGPSPGNGPKPEDDPSPSVADAELLDPLAEEF